MIRTAVELMERRWLPDPAIRWGIRRLLQHRLHRQAAAPPLPPPSSDPTYTTGPIASHTADANEQHYELPQAFFALMLGPRLKYSSAWFADADTTLADAEEAMLALTCRRADLRDGQHILELGCGWGSLSLWMAEHYPHARITAISNAHSQRECIQAEAARRGLANLTVVTADINDFRPDGRFDRVVSVEMFEHMQNYRELLRRIASWLQPDGRLFVHLFCHRTHHYRYATEGATDWMGKYFFTGGTMPSYGLLPALDTAFAVEEQWPVNGSHYHRTLEAWLVRLDQRADEALDILRLVYGAGQAARWLQRWRMFLLACSELFAYHGGEEWFVAHYRFQLREHAE
jgi:cyclopropane-fatty-acyl-phospholipid synthase